MIIRDKLRVQRKNFKIHKYHQGHKRNVGRTLKKIEAQKGKTDPKLINISNEYALDVFGAKKYAYWLYVYSAISEEFKEGWIPDNYYGAIVVPKLKGDYGEISNLNGITNNLFNSELFPDKVYFINGLFLSRNLKILSKNEVEVLLFKNSEKVIFKLDNSKQGLGVFVFNKTNFEIGKIKKLGNGVFQEFINQHSFFDEFMSESVSTIRVTTVIDNESNCTARASVLRVGRSSETHVSSNSQIKVNVDLANGDLSQLGYMPNFQTIDSHPDTGTKFAQKTIPCFDKCVDSAINLHKKFPLARSIGWDMVIDQNNDVKIMEWNGKHNDIKFSEATVGPIFSDLGWEKLWNE